MRRGLLSVALLTWASFALALAQDPATTTSHGPVVFPTTTNAADSTVTPPQANVPTTPVQSVITPIPQRVAPQIVPPSLPSSPMIMPGQSSGLPGAASGPPSEDIKDIRPPFFYLHSWMWFWVALGVVALIALVVVLWKFLKSPAALNPKSAYELALENLEKARNILDEQKPEPYAVLVSETVRHYLGQRFQTPSTRRTTEEFLRQMQTEAGTPLAEHRGLLGGFLEACDLVKFAHYQPSRDELEDVQQRAVTFVTATNPSSTAASNSVGSTP